MLQWLINILLGTLNQDVIVTEYENLNYILLGFVFIKFLEFKIWIREGNDTFAKFQNN